MALQTSIQVKAVLKYNNDSLNVSQYFGTLDEAKIFATNLVDGSLDITNAQIIINYGQPK